MNKSSHVLIGKLLCRRLSERYGVYLDTEGFLVGSILPDIGISFLIRPHFLKNHRRSMARRIDNILMYDKQTSAFFGRSYSMELGILCHYYADFLCYAHGSAFSGDLRAHVKYEKDLQGYLTGRCLDAVGDDYVPAPRGEATAEEIFARFMARHDSHVKEAPSFENDVSHCLTACTEALVLLTSAVLVERSDELELLFPA